MNEGVVFHEHNKCNMWVSDHSINKKSFHRI